MATENSPLLGGNGVREGGERTVTSSSSTADASDCSKHTILQKAIRHLQKWRTVYIVALLVLMEDFPDYMRMAPVIEALQDRICYDYYRYTGPDLNLMPENDCKIDAIQTKLSNVRGWFYTLQILPGMR